MKKNIILILIFIAGVLTTIFFERITETIFPKGNETVNLAKDTLYVIPITNEKVIVERNSEPNNSTNKELEYWKDIALKKESVSNESLAKEINNLKKEIKSTKGSNKLSPEFISDKGYNELITNSKTLLPNKKGYQPSSVTNFFEGKCPDFNVNDDYINVDFLIRDKNVYEKSGIIFVSMTGVNKDGQHYFIYDEYYKPQYGFNHLKIKNIKKSGKYIFTYGIIFKSDMKNEFPSVNGFNCHFKK
jgi:hypothetical protein